MKSWIVEPRDTLVLRDGRPLLEAAPRMRTLPFPWPSTTAGLARTCAGRATAGAGWDHAALRRVPVRGPWLVELDGDGRAIETYLPAPRDCLWYVEGEGPRTRHRVRLLPRPLPPGAATDLGSAEIVRPAVDLPDGRESLRGPTFWRAGEVTEWLSRPLDDARLGVAGETQDPLARLGEPGFVVEERCHVAIGTGGTAKEGALFSTAGLRLLRTAAPSSVRPSGARRFGIGFGCDDTRIRSGPVVLGGERRVSFLRSGSGEPPVASISVPRDARRVRVLLVTPGLFSEGYRPTDPPGGRIVAACVGRPEPISGWSFEHRGPRKSRRMAPAGSVYWVDLDPGTDAAQWASERQFSSLCDEEQDRLDGFGMVLVGVA